MPQILSGDCRVLLAAMAENSVDSIITDPPYGLSQDPDIAEVLRHWLAGEFYEHGSAGFMGRGWDSFVPGPDYWHAAFRVLKPGGFLLAFSSTRTWDLLSMAIRFAGFENRDTIRFDGPPALGWTHGQGFPKGQNLAKAGAGEDWEGWNTTLKPAWEVILVFRKPPDGTVVANVKRWGVGGINVGGARVGASKRVPGGLSSCPSGGVFKNLRQQTGEEDGHDPNLGRWPANWILSHLPGCEKVGTQRVKTETAYEPSKEVKRTVYRDTMALGRQCGYAGEDGKEEVEKWECVEGCPVQALAAQSGESRSTAQRFQVQGRSGGIMGGEGASRDYVGGHDDAGTATRFFHCLPPDAPPHGRWPANWILSHLPGCEHLGVRQVKNPSGGIAPGTARENAVLSDLGASPGWTAHGDANGMELVDEWTCAEGCPVKVLAAQSGELKSGGGDKGSQGIGYGGSTPYSSPGWEPDTGTAARFFHCLPPDAPPFSYQAKAASRERSRDAEHLLWARDRSRPSGHRPVSKGEWEALPERERTYGNIHPTVKPLALARLLARLYCPKGGVVLDMFAGSGTLPLGAKLEGMEPVAMEMDPDYLRILEARLGGGDKMGGMEQISLPVPVTPALDQAALAARMAGCTKCPARCGAVVPGFLPEVSPALVVIGPGPGYRERLLGRPFVGGAGGVLWGALTGAGYERKEVALLNAAACAGGAPEFVEMLNCYEFLAPQVRALAPRAILALGPDVLRLLGGGGRWHGIPVLAAPLPGGDGAALAGAVRAARRVTHG